MKWKTISIQVIFRATTNSNTWILTKEGPFTPMKIHLLQTFIYLPFCFTALNSFTPMKISASKYTEWFQRFGGSVSVGTGN
jgi:hypothetical protein